MNIRWQIHFKSRQGMSCLINIYEQDWPSGNITEVVGAENPIEYEEEADTDLLIPVRYRTGYIRVVEQVYGELSAMRTDRPMQHFVEAYYGSRLDFIGFLQTQDFDSPFSARPCVLELPIVSPIGILDQIDFDVEEPTAWHLGFIMKKIFDKLPAKYQRIIYPTATTDLMRYLMPSTAYCGFNAEHTWNNSKPAFAPTTMMAFLENLMKNFGYTLHDAGTDIIITQPRNGAYSYRTINHITNDAADGAWNVITSDEQTKPFGDDYVHYSADDTMTSIEPLKEVKIEAAEAKPLTLNTDFCNQAGIVNIYSSGEDQCTAFNLTTDTTIVTAPHIGRLSDSNSRGLFPAAVATLNAGATSQAFSGKWMVRYDKNWSIDTPLIVAKFISVPPFVNYTTQFHMTVNCSSNIAKLNAKWSYNKWFKVVMKDVRGRTLFSQNVELDKENFSIVPASQQPYSSWLDWSGLLIASYSAVAGNADWHQVPITVEVYALNTSSTFSSRLKDGDILAFDFGFEEPRPVFQDMRPFKYEQVNPHGGSESVSIILPFCNYSGNGCEIPFTPEIAIPDYSHMFELQTWATHTCVKRSGIGADYIRKYTHWDTGMKCRIIADAFNMAEDTHTITLVNYNSI